MDLQAYLGERRDRVQKALDEALPPRHPDPGRLVESMRYTLLLPNGRLRGVVCLAACELFGGREAEVMPVATAAEMVHAASLVLDDLPAFDNTLRRLGAPANHRVFGEATAMLASIGLLGAAFRHLARSSRPRLFGPDDAVPAIVALSDAVGEKGMALGQAMDLIARGGTPGLPELEQIHAMKTASLFAACAVESARRSGAGPAAQGSLRTYARQLGLALRISDELVASNGDPQAEAVECASRTAFATCAGREAAVRLARELADAAARALVPLGKRAATLDALARWVAGRAA